MEAGGHPLVRLGGLSLVPETFDACKMLGTLVLFLLGDGVVRGVLLKRSKAEGAGWIVITNGWRSR